MSSREDPSKQVVIVGGGIIGIACAHYLNEAGFQVTVVDKSEIGKACSFRNCGLICPSHVLPLAEPGTVQATIMSMLSGGGAFKIRPRVDLRLWRWFLNFWKRCNREDMLESARAIQPLLTSSHHIYEDLLGSGSIECEYRTEGLMFVYKNQQAFNSYSPTNDLLSSQFNEPARRLETKELVEFEPSLKGDLAGAWLYESDAHLRPERLLSSWIDQLTQKGVSFIENCELQSIQHSQQQVQSIRAGGQELKGSHFVFATGAWTPLLKDLLGIYIPIQPGKGYSVTLPVPENSPRVPMIFPEHRVAVTPMESGLRLGSIMEFSGYDTSFKNDRLRLLTEGTKEYLRSPLTEVASEHWFGWRPMTYDTTPVIGNLPGRLNAFLATGHNMLGLSMAPATGLLIKELICGEKPHLDIAPYKVDRW